MTDSSVQDAPNAHDPAHLKQSMRKVALTALAGTSIEW